MPPPAIVGQGLELASHAVAQFPKISLPGLWWPLPNSHLKDIAYPDEGETYATVELSDSQTVGSQKRLPTISWRQLGD